LQRFPFSWRAGAAMIGGLGLMAGGLGSAAAYLFLILLAPESRAPLASVTSVASLAVLGLGLGLPLFWHGLRAWQGHRDTPFAPPRAAVLALIYLAAVGIGQGVLSFQLSPRLLFPPFHVLAGALPPLIVLAFVGRRLGQATRRREVIGQMASGVVIGGAGAIVLVGLAAVGVALALGALLALTPGGLQSMQSLLEQLQQPGWGQTPDDLLSLLFTPPGMVGLLLVVVIIGPLVEELFKPAGMLFIRRRPGKAAAFLWGVAGAAAFAAAEGMLNGSVSLEAWLIVIVMRIGTALIHCLGGGLVGLGWYALRTSRQPWRALGLYLAAATLHGTWNLVTLGISGTALGLEALGETVVGLGMLSLIGVLAMLFLASVAGLGWLVHWLAADVRSASAASDPNTKIRPQILGTG